MKEPIVLISDIFSLANKVQLSRLEQAYIESITQAQTPSDILFARLCQYAHGGHHLDEIVWRENLTRQSVVDVLDDPKYSALCQIQHERRFERMEHRAEPE